MAIIEALAVGQELPVLEKEPSQRRIDAYSGVRPRSIHTASRKRETAGSAESGLGGMAIAVLDKAFVSLGG